MVFIVFGKVFREHALLFLLVSIRFVRFWWFLVVLVVLAVVALWFWWFVVGPLGASPTISFDFHQIC